MRSEDTSPDAERVQLEAYRAMEPSARLRIGLELTAMSRNLLADGIRARHPEYTLEEVRLAEMRAWLGPEQFRAAFPDSPELES